MTATLSLGIYLLHGLLLPPILVGFIRMAKARIQQRRGPSLFQPFFDLAKLFRKGETVSETTTWVFRWAPVANLASLGAIALMTPWLGIASPIPGDLFLLIYLLALGKFAIGLAALDTGSAFGAIGASREAAVSVQSEPAMVMGLAALAVLARTSSLQGMLTPGHGGDVMVVIVPLVLIALWLAVTAELARMPFDDPTTHLELTMIHEALILENSGRNLALIEYGVALKTTLLLGLVAQVVLLAWPPLPMAVRYGATLACMGGAAALVAVAESVLVRLRWRRIPSLLSFALAAGVLACLVVAVRG